MNIFETITTATTNMTGTIVLRSDNCSDIFVVAIENNDKKVFRCSPDKKQYKGRKVQIRGFYYSTSGVKRIESLPEFDLRSCSHTVAVKIFNIVSQIETIPQKLLKISDLTKEEKNQPTEEVSVDSNDSTAQKENETEMEMDELEKFISLTFENKEANRLLEMVQEFCELPDPYTLELIFAFNTECEKFNSNSESMRRLDSEIEDIEYKINGLYISRQKLIDIRNQIDELITSSSKKKASLEKLISSYIKKMAAQEAAKKKAEQVAAKKDELEKLRKRVKELETELGKPATPKRIIKADKVKEVATIKEEFSWSMIQKHINDYLQNRLVHLDIDLLKEVGTRINKMKSKDLNAIMGDHYARQLLFVLHALKLTERKKSGGRQTVTAGDPKFIKKDCSRYEYARRMLVVEAYKKIWG